MEAPRQKLINLVHGGDGRVAPWIEKATLRQPGQEDAAVYVVHLPGQRNDGRDLIVVPHDGNLQTCQDVLLLIENHAQPGTPDTTPEEAAAALEAKIAALPQPEDCGRVVADLADLDYKD